MKKNIIRIMGFVFVIFAAFATAAVIGLSQQGDDKKKADEDDEGPVLIQKAIIARAYEMVTSRPSPRVMGAKFGVAKSPKGIDVLRMDTQIVNGKAGIKMASVNALQTTNNGVSWRSVPLYAHPEEPDRYVGDIQAFKLGLKMVVAVTAQNTLGTTFLELGCMQRAWPLPASYFKGDCGGREGDAYAKCRGGRAPRACMFAPGDEAPPVDDHQSKIGDDLDMLDFRVGYDDKTMKFDMMIQGDFSAGSLTPVAFNQYSVVIMNTDSKDLEPPTGLPLEGVLVRYIPMAVNSLKLFPACAAALRKKDQIVYDTQSVSCKVNGNHLSFKVSRSIFGNKPPKEIFMFGQTGIVRESRFDQFSVGDITGLTRVRFGARSLAFVDPSKMPPVPAAQWRKQNSAANAPRAKKPSGK